MKKIFIYAKKHKLKFIAIACLSVAIFATTIVSVIQKRDEHRELQEKPELEWKTYEMKNNSGKIGKALVTFRNEKGYKEIHYPTVDGQEELITYPNGKTIYGIDYEMEDLKTYEFKAILQDNTVETYTINYEIPRIKGNYTKVGTTYVNEPNLTGLIPEKTRYLYLKDVQEEVDDGNGGTIVNNVEALVPGNWITDEKPDTWYNYEEKKWANIYSEVNGIENYYVWIPRYCYKLDSSNQRSDIKFINTYNEYLDPLGNITEWQDLQSMGYKLPEAFTWKYEKTEVPLIIDGYWLSKYQLSNLSSYKLNYNLVASPYAFNVKNFTNNVQNEATKYTYAINGTVVHESSTLENYAFENGTANQANNINVTALNNLGEIVASMTKELELVDVNPPDLTGLDPDTTFYVYWDENENEHNEIPISMDPPQNWYNYSYSNWANIVTRNEGLENYYVWIPRYQYLLDQTSQRSEVKFINGLGRNVDTGYKIPEAFTWTNQSGENIELPGYWLTKYQLSVEDNIALLDAEMSPGKDSILIKDLVGSKIDNIKNNNTNINIEYYLNGNKIHDGTDYLEHYLYTGLEYDKVYTVNIIVRNNDTDEYIGSITKKVRTQVPNKPVMTGLNENQTYYVLYNEDGTEIIGDKIKQDGSNIPENWYDYQNSKWANIVVTNGTVLDGVITGATVKNYFTWLPRYEYRILGDRANLSTANRRIETNFLIGDEGAKTSGYRVPEAFTFTNDDGTTANLKGYWLSKYQLSN